MDIQNLIIIGAGPAGLTAALYAGRCGLSPLLFEGEMAGGVPPGGQLTTTTLVENFPGFSDGIDGAELMARMRNQALKFGTVIHTKTIDRVDFFVKPFQVFSQKECFYARSVIIATGATAKRLGVLGEADYWQKGISACAVCDGGLPIFRDKVLAVVGGGDTAIEEALYLTKFASQVILCVRRDQLRASKIMQDQLFSNPKIFVRWNTVVLEARGNGTHLTHLQLSNVKTQEQTLIEVAGLFYAVGHQPNTVFLGQQLSMTSEGYILVTAGTTQTNVAGVFACGDVIDSRYRQAVVAAGTGCMASLDVQKYLGDSM